MAEYILTPSGRLVQGSLFVPNDKDMAGRPLTDRNNNPRVEYFFAIAVPKTDPLWPAVWQHIQQIAQAGFPGGQSQQPDFSWKILDGDDPKHSGKDGFVGCNIIKMKSGFATKVYKHIDGRNQEVFDDSQVKKGDWVQAQISVVPNGDISKPGVYINHHAVMHVGYGAPITSGPSADEVFGATALAVPQGASATPVAATAPPAAPAATAPPAAPAATAPPAAPATTAPPASPAATAPPASPAATAPPAAPAATAPPAAPAATAPHAGILNPTALVMSAAANGVPYESYVAQGWTDKMLIDAGMANYPDDVPF